MKLKRIIYRSLCSILGVAGGILSINAEVVSSGTGFVISDDGKIFTELSVVKNTKDLLVYGLGTSNSEVYHAEVVLTDETKNIAILKVNKFVPTYKTGRAKLSAADTVKVIYDKFSMFNNEVLIKTLTVKSDAENSFRLVEALEESAVGAPVLNKYNRVVGFVSKGTDGKADKVVEFDSLPEFQVVDKDVFLEALPLVCAVVGHDEQVEIEGFAGSFSVEKQDKEEKKSNILELLGLEMIQVEGGTFMMGCAGNYADCQSAEKPAHEVRIDSFRLAKYEVTQKQWNLVMDSNPSPIKGDDLPVYNVSYDDVQEFISRLNSVSGASFRLPTEAEWEFAAKGGVKSQGLKYAGSDNLDEVAWYRDNSGAKPHAVGTKKPNELGLYDMSGNVSEWCIDDYKSYSAPDYKPYYYSKFVDLEIPDTMIVAVRDSFALYKIDESEKLSNKLTKGRKVMRGSGYFYEKSRCNLSYRRACATTDKYTFGFRLAE